MDSISFARIDSYGNDVCASQVFASSSSSEHVFCSLLMLNSLFISVSMKRRLAIYAFGFANSVLILKLGYSLNTLIILLSDAFDVSALAANNSRCFSIALMHQIPVYSFPCVPPDIVTVLIGVLNGEEATPTCKNAAARKTLLKKFIIIVVNPATEMKTNVESHRTAMNVLVGEQPKEAGPAAATGSKQEVSLLELFEGENADLTADGG